MKAVAQYLISSINIKAMIRAIGTLMSTRDQFCMSEAIAVVDDPNAPPMLPLIVAEVGRQAVLATE